jgi:rRNA maturation endonuclease Nob1
MPVDEAANEQQYHSDAECEVHELADGQLAFTDLEVVELAFELRQMACVADDAHVIFVSDNLHKMRKACVDE